MSKGLAKKSSQRNTGSRKTAKCCIRLRRQGLTHADIRKMMSNDRTPPASPEKQSELAPPASPEMTDRV